MNDFVTVGRTRGPAGRASLDERRASSLGLAVAMLERAGVPATRDAAGLRHDRMGRPLLTINGAPGPWVSFSHWGGFTWAALAVGPDAVGVDAVAQAEFDGPYPFRRAFHPEEWSSVEKMLPASRAAALLWAAKEASVKAWGCGFKFLDPVDVRVELLRGDLPKKDSCGMSAPHAVDFRVSAVDANPLRIAHGEPIARARCFPIDPDLWVAVALAPADTKRSSSDVRS
jgi:phosphopantetheinyl transferase